MLKTIIRNVIYFGHLFLGEDSDPCQPLLSTEDMTDHDFIIFNFLLPKGSKRAGLSRYEGFLSLVTKSSHQFERP